MTDKKPRSVDQAALDIIVHWNSSRTTHSVGLLLGHLVLGILAVAAGLAWAKGSHLADAAS